jgi:formate transporter
MPADMARKAETVGVRKVGMATTTLFALVILAGAFIAMGAIFSTTISSGSIAIKDPGGAAAFATGLAYGFTRLLAGVLFCLGLILVVVGEAEILTGNNLIVIAWASGKVSTLALLRNWLIVYLCPVCLGFSFERSGDRAFAVRAPPGTLPGRHAWLSGHPKGIPSRQNT